MSAPHLSVIVSLHNLEFYIERCLDSLAAQTMKEIEILIVDEGSTDDSAMLAEEYQQRDLRFRLLQEGGLSGTKGEYLIFVDGGDYLDPDTCEVMYAKAVEQQADLLLGNCKHLLVGGRNELVRPIEIETERLLTAQDRAHLFSTWATGGRLYRRAIFDDPAVRFSLRVNHADLNFTPRSLFSAQRIYYVNREFYNRDVTRPTQSRQQADSVVRALQDMLAFFKLKRGFEAYEQELRIYALRHVISCIGRVRALGGDAQESAVAELFGVLDEHFGTSWLGAPLEKELGERRALLVCQARRFNYRPLVWIWRLRDQAWNLDKQLERVLSFPLNKYRKAKDRLKNGLIGD